MHIGTNLPGVRDYNERPILRTIREGDGTTRAEIAEKTGLTAQTVSNLARRLLSQRLVGEATNGAPKRGKPGVRLRIDPHAGYALGVQIDGDDTSLAVADLLVRTTARTQRHQRQALRTLGRDSPGRGP